MERIIKKIADELSVGEHQVRATVKLLEDSTVPFIARYRKEATGGLDDTQLRKLEERLGYLKQLEERRQTVLETIREQGKLTPELEADILAAETQVRLEDLYLPYRPKRRTKAQIAREAGLEPLAKLLLSDPSQEPEEAAASFVDPEKGVADAKGALDGARQILMEEFSEDAELVTQLRDYVEKNGVWKSQVAPGKEEAGAKFRDYFDYSEPIQQLPSHRILALFRGRREGILRLNLLPDSEPETGPREMSRPEQIVARQLGFEQAGRPADDWLQETIRWAWKIKISTRLETDFENQLREQAEDEAIRVFGENLRDLLLAAPAGSRSIIGLDPGFRTGVKVAVADSTGKLLDTATIYPHEPRREWQKSMEILAALARKHQAELISIGNGTASRETDRLCGELLEKHPELRLTKITVSEAGASVYSASEFAASEFPGLDVSLRGAVSIARRLQDPLAELVKIEPKAIGVGQYQHDVNQVKLGKKLDSVVEDCVNAVGVDLNTASVPLLTRVSGLGPTVASSIVAYRDANGQFQGREQLKKVAGLGPKTFELAAGFLRIRDGQNPLDASAVHPEAYPVVQRIVEATQKSIKDLIGASKLLNSLDPRRFVDDQFGEPTVRDILAELHKPGRDPRPVFETAKFREGVEKVEDLEVGMVLEGVVTNVTNFGAFVDVGVHQDGLVHISELSDRFIQDPREAVKTGEVVKVKVLEVDLQRKRIGLSVKALLPARQAAERPASGRPAQKNRPSPSGRREPKASQGGFNRPFGVLADLKLKKTPSSSS